MGITSFPQAGVSIDEHGIVTVTIRDAGSLNVLGTPVITDLTRALRQLADHAGTRAVVLRGTATRPSSPAPTSRTWAC